MFLTIQKDFLIREFSLSDFESLFLIADNINKQAAINKEFQPFYAFNIDVREKNYSEILKQKTKIFLERAIFEKEQQPRSTHRLALCLPNNKLIGNITVDILPFQDETGKTIFGDLGYFIDPVHGRKGLMSKAVEHILTQYFSQQTEMDVTVHPHNVHSLRMMQRFNAHITGIKEKTEYQGEPRLLLKLLKDDFLIRGKPVFILKKKCLTFKPEKERGSYV